MGRYIVRAAHELCLRLRSAIRLRLVGSAVQRRHGLLCVGLRRTVHLRIPRSGSGRRRDVVDGRERGTARAPASSVRAHRAAHPRSAPSRARWLNARVRTFTLQAFKDMGYFAPESAAKASTNEIRAFSYGLQLS